VFDHKEFRKQFPILNRTVNGSKLIYFDNAATMQKPKVVTDFLVDFYQSSYSNIHRSVHTLSHESTQLYENTRQKVAEFINAPLPKRGTPQNIVFTSGTTDSVNLLANSWGEQNVKAGDEIILSVSEHHSNLIPWQMLAKRKGAVLRFVSICDDGELNYEQFETLFSDKTVLVAISLMSNVLGVVNDGKRIVDFAHAKGVPVFFDAAQAVVHSKIDVQQLDCDFLAFSAHKLYGPTGVGVLYGKTELLNKMPPWKGGGEMINVVSLNDFSAAPSPFRFEAGTPNIAGVVAFGKTLDFLNEYKGITEYETELTNYLVNRLRELNEVEIFSGNNTVGIVAFSVADIHPHDLTHFLDQEGIAARAGHHCAQPLLSFFEVNSLNRVSVSAYNTKDEVDSFIEALKKALEFFAR